MKYLEENGLMGNTMIVYTSDQGFYMGEHGWFDKRFMYEESFGMPMVMRWPGHIKPGTQVTGLTQNIDFAPTFLDMCGISIPQDMQGVSFKDWWKKARHRATGVSPCTITIMSFPASTACVPITV